jgi:hypothetical protein
MIFEENDFKKLSEKRTKYSNKTTSCKAIYMSLEKNAIRYFK